MSEKANEEVVRQLVECVNERRFDEMGDLLSDDSVTEYPQSGERIVGRKNLVDSVRAFPDMPTLKITRLQASGDMVVAEGEEAYSNGERWFAILAYTVKNGKITQEIGYWSKPFPAPEWRKRWVEK